MNHFDVWCLTVRRRVQSESLAQATTGMMQGSDVIDIACVLVVESNCKNLKNTLGDNTKALHTPRVIVLVIDNKTLVKIRSFVADNPLFRNWTLGVTKTPSK